VSARIARAAALIAVLTVVARLAGFARIVVFSKAVGYTNLGDVYQAANTVPNIVFEIVAGGALAALVVPLLAGPLAAGDRPAVDRTVSALLSWMLLVLVPLAVLVAVAAYPIMWLLDHDASPRELATGARMLRVFAPQLPLYGVSIVLSGVLQAHRRFAWPVLAPLLSSVTVIGAYLLFFAVVPAGVDIPQLGTGGELILSVGTTLGVAVLSLCLVPPVRRLGVRPRPGLSFAAEQRATVGSLAAVGALTVLAQQLSLGLFIVLAQWRTAKGSLVLLTQAQTIYLVPWAVLALPVATSAFPALAHAWAVEDRGEFQRTLARATRGLLLLVGLGAAALVALAGPTARLLAGVTRGVPDTRVLAWSIAGFAPGLFGYALYSLHSRALYAQGNNRDVARATLLGWGGAMLAAALLALLLPARYRVPAVTVGNSLGMLLLGAVLLVLVARRAGRPALAGVAGTGAVAVLAGVVSAGAGIAARLPLGATRSVAGTVAAGILSAVVLGAVFAGLALLLDPRDARPAAGALARRLGRRVGLGTGVGRGGRIGRG
jgi:putative peptidoglycan lipid II flippase